MFDQLRLALQRRLERLTGQSTAQPAPASDPAYARDLRTKGNDLLAEGKLNEAETCFREALAHKADDTRTLVCLGYVLKEQGRLAEARIALKRATHPTNTDLEVFEALYLLGEISQIQGDLDDAQRSFSAALELKPDFTRACKDVLRIMQLQGRESEATAFMETLVDRCPDCVDYRLKLAELYTNALMFEGTLDHLMAAIALGVNDVRIHMMLGAVLCRLEREEESRKYFELAEIDDPSVAYETHYHLGYFHTRSGNSKLAVELLEKSIELQPDFIPSHSLLLLNLSHAAAELNKSYRAAAERFAQMLESVAAPMPPIANWIDGGEDKVLRIGFVAGEFREHPLYHFLVGILEQIDRSEFQLVAFSSNEFNDQATDKFKALFGAWHDIKQLSDEAAADLVRAQHIDVLIDLSGHTGDARLPVFARKPALVQVAWLGYFASTGLRAMDYIVADPVCVPEDSQEWFSEKVARLPETRLCMTVPKTSRVIPVCPPPCVAKGYVTFGSFQQASKINARVLRIWAKVMASVPQSRLRIQNKAIDSASIRDKICSDIALAGIDLERVELVGAMGWEEYLQAHGEVDFILDTFPYTGGTTTAFALWMGVPTLTLKGNSMLSLQGASMLKCVGLADWIAEDEAEYVEMAKYFASEPEQLVTLRTGLRDVTAQSALFDTKRFARDLQVALRSMYQEKLTETKATHTVLPQTTDNALDQSVSIEEGHSLNS